MRALSEGFSKNIPIAYYAALLMSNVGHSMPLICESCWDYCEILIMHGKISHVLHVLQLTLPYYLESIESLLSLEKFVLFLAGFRYLAYSVKFYQSLNASIEFAGSGKLFPN